MDNQGLSRYKTMLLEVSDLLQDEDLRRMKFRCDNFIKKRESEKITHGTQLFTALEEREHLGQTDTEFLKDLLRSCCSGRIDGLRIVERYEQMFGIAQPNDRHVVDSVGLNVPGVSAQPQIIYVVQDSNQQANGLPATHVQHKCNNINRQRYEGPDLTQEISHLSKCLGRDWRFFMRALKVNEDDIESVVCDYRTVRERIHQCLLLWQVQEQQCASRQKLICALRDPSVERNDLASALEELQAGGN